MKFARYRSGEQISYGIVEGDTVRDISGPPCEAYQATGATHKLSDVKLLVPTEPKNILTTGINSRSHAISEQNKPNNPRLWETMAEPMVSIRNITSAIGHGDDIIRPDGAETLREEVELVVVMGKICKKVPMPEIYDYIFGYTIGNDPHRQKLGVYPGSLAGQVLRHPPPHRPLDRDRLAPRQRHDDGQDKWGRDPARKHRRTALQRCPPHQPHR